MSCHLFLHHSRKPDEEKERFWNKVFVFAGDMNGHIGSSDVGYDGTHGGLGYGSRNAVYDKGVKDSWKEYMEKMMNKENEWDHRIPAGVRKDQQTASGFLK